MSTDRIEHDRVHGVGATTWYFPDGDRPPVGDGPIEAHESLMIFNVGSRDAHVAIDLYWTDDPPDLGTELVVPAERVRCLRVPWRTDDQPAREVPVRTQYALRVRSDVPVVCQYGRAETEPTYTLYTTMGFVG